MTADAPTLAAELLAELCASQAQPGRVGVFAEDLPPISAQTFLSVLLKGTQGRELRIAVLGGKGVRAPRGATVTTDPLEANRWRNDATARGGTPTVVLVVGPAPKLNSLRTAFPTLGTRDLRRHAVARAIALRDTHERRAFWGAIEEMPGEVPIKKVLEAVAHVAALSQAALLEGEAQAASKLGLLPTPRLSKQGGPAKARAELRRNLEIVRKLRDLSVKDREHLVDMADTGAPPDRRVAEAILRYEATGKDEDLSHLTLEAVQAALRWRPKPTPRATAVDNEDEDDDDAATPRRREPERDADAIAGEILVFGDGDITSVSKKVEREIQSVEDDDEARPVSILDRKVAPRPRSGSREMGGLFGALLSPATWGGVISGTERIDFKEAIKRAPEGSLEVEVFEPEAEDGLVWTLRRAVKQGLARTDVLERWTRYAQARADLLPWIDQLVDRPVFAIAGDPSLANAITAAVTSFGDALAAVQEVAEELAKRSSIERSQKLYAQAVCLDVVFFVSEAGSKAIMSPLHPFHLWRCSALLEILRSYKDDLAELGEEEVTRLIEDAPLNAPNLVLSPFVTSHIARPLYFMATASLGAVPLYVEPTARSLGRYKSRALVKIVDRFLRLSPHAGLGLQIALIDPPSLVGVLENLLSIKSPLGDSVPLHVRVFRTRKATDETEADEERALILAGELRDADGSLALLEPSHNLDAVTDLLSGEPAHITAVFEPGEAVTVHIGVASPPPLSPLSLPRFYRYDAFEDRIDVVVAGELAPLSRFHDFYCRVLGVPTTDFVGRRSGVKQHARALERLARRTMWLTVVDQGVEPTIRLEGAPKIDQRPDAGRDVVTFTAFSETIEDLVRDVARQAGIPTDVDTVRRLQAQLFRISGEVTLMLSTGSSGLALVNPRIATGIVGVAAAARWYERLHPEALLLSIDDETSRRWILGHNQDGRRADLFGVRATPEGVVVDVMEVKTHEHGEAGLSTSGGSIEGEAASQVDQTIKVLRDLLVPKHASPVVRARADVLRDQLYRAVASRDYDPRVRGQLVNMLDELFSSGAAGIGGLIFLVRIAPNVSGTGPSSAHPYKTSGGNVVGLVELEEGGARRPPRTEPPAEPAPTPASPPVPSSAQAPRVKRPSRGAEPKSTTTSAEQTSSQRPQVYVGTAYTEEEVYWDPQRPDRPLNNFGFLVTGDSGAGKTQMIRALIAATAPIKLPVCVLDFKNDFSSPEFCAQAKLEAHDVNRRGLPFNPLSLVPDDRGECQPIRQAHEIAGILRRVFGLGDQQESRLKAAIVAAYEEVGVDPREWRRVTGADPAPSFEDVIRILRRGKKNDALLNRLSKLSDLNLLPHDSDATISFERLLQSRVSLDLHGLPDETTKEAIAEFIIVRLHSFMLRGEQPRQLRRLLVLDEAWRVKDSERLQELAREGRAFGVGVVIGTQFPEDIPDTLSGNLATRLYLYNQNDDHRRAVLRALCGSTSSEAARDYLAKLQALQKHEGFFHNQQHTPAVLVKTLPHYERVMEPAST